ncbi:MAG: DUF421 domain-containing protein [Sphingobacteriales bacterium]|nr:MAG: DUF421 domain-containing protein [Sphingobacteriales bacterium]
MEKLLFTDWKSIYHVAVCATLSYFTLFLFIRISGKRTLAKLTAFDFVVTITLGSILSSMILKKTTLAEGAVALIVIILLQYMLAFAAKKSSKIEKLVNSKPTLLFYNGAFLEDAMEAEVITKEEIYAAVREFRIYSLDDVKAVVMEINGELTVVKKTDSPVARHSLADIDTEEDSD